VLCVGGMFFDCRVQSLASENQSPKALISSQASISGNFLHKQLSTKFKTSSVPTVRSFFFLLEGGGHRRLVPTARSFFFGGRVFVVQ
jgi:hypothetical protein